MNAACCPQPAAIHALAHLCWLLLLCSCCVLVLVAHAARRTTAIAAARGARDASLLDPLAELFEDDAMLINANLCNTVYAFAEPACGGRGIVAHLKEFWFGPWDVEVSAE